MSVSILSLAKTRLQPRLKRLLKPGRVRWIRRIWFFLLGMGVTSGLLLMGLMLYLSERAYPGVGVAGRDVSLYPTEMVEGWLNNAYDDYSQNLLLTFLVDGRRMELPVPVDSLRFDARQTAKQVVEVGKQGSYVQRLQNLMTCLREGENVELAVGLTEATTEAIVATLSASINKPYISPSIEVSLAYPRIIILPGEAGQVVNEEALKILIRERLANLSREPIRVPIETREVKLTEEQLETTRQAAESLLGKSLWLTYSDESQMEQKWEIGDEEMILFLEAGKGFSREKVEAYLKDVAEVIDRPAENPRFRFNADIGRVEEFLAPKLGLTMDVKGSTEAVMRELASIGSSQAQGQVELIVRATEPELGLEEVNTLGINELLGRGVSTYYGSAPSRVHNIALAAARISGTLVKPGEIFSLNEAVGEVSKATGFQEAYVIFEGRTELGDGGGVCQDSTTVFRAALDAGLPIMERKPHSYRVGYYEQDTKPGLDATVYPPYADLKFLNDTPAHILVQAMADSPNRTLTVDIYGTSDGRKSEISNHVVWDVSPAPPDVYVDDPTLPAGEVRQIEKPVGGAKAKFDYKVVRDGETRIEETFYSYYKPWAAAFLRGTAEQ